MAKQEDSHKSSKQHPWIIKLMAGSSVWSHQLSNDSQGEQHTSDRYHLALAAPSLSSNMRLFLLIEHLVVLLPRLHRVSKGQNQR